MNTLSRAIVRYSLLLVSLCLASVAWSQDPEIGDGGSSDPYTTSRGIRPETSTISPGGVDISSGRWVGHRDTDLSVGTLALTRTLTPGTGTNHIGAFGNFSHNWDITLVERRTMMAEGYYNWGGQDFRMIITLDGERTTFDGWYGNNQPGFTQPNPNTPLATLTRTGLGTSAGVIYNFQSANGTRVTFRPLGSNDCSTIALRCAYPSQVVYPDGTTLYFEYEVKSPAALHGTRLRSITSNHGFALVFEYTHTNWNLVTKACALNLAVTAKPTNNICPTSAVATVTYGYSTLSYSVFSNMPMLASVTDAVGGVSTFQYTAIPPPTADSYEMRLTKPGHGNNWQTVTISTNLDAEASPIVTRQQYADGSSYTYSYVPAPWDRDGTSNGVAGGTMTDAQGRVTTVLYDFPAIPAQMLPPRGDGTVNVGDTIFQTSPGPVEATDPLGRVTRWNYCDANVMAWLSQCYITYKQSVTSPGGVSTYYTYHLGHVSGTRQVAVPGSGLPDMVNSLSGHLCTLANTALCGKFTSRTDAKGNVTDFTFDSNHAGVLTITLPAPSPGTVRPQKRFGYMQLYAWYKNSSGTLVQAPAPVWLLTSISECRTLASCVGTADETRTTITYGTPGTPNNLLPTAISVAAGDGSLAATANKVYDAQGNLIFVDGPLPGTADTVRTHFDALRRVTGEVSADPDGGAPLPYRAVRNTYSAAGDLTKVEQGTVLGQTDGDWAGFVSLETTDTMYDIQGRKVRESVSAVGTTYSMQQFSYDLGRRLECTAVRMDPAQWNSQTNACIPQTSGPHGPDRVSRNFYNAAGERTTLQVAVGTSVQSDELTTTYTPDGEVATLTDGEGNKTTYEYDGHRRPWRTRYPHLTTKGSSSSSDYEQLAYDANGNITQRRLRDGQLINFSYDNLNRVTLKDLPSPEIDVTYNAYDLQGRLLHQYDVFSLAWNWDALGRMRTESGPLGTMSYDYDAAGRRIKTTWPDGFYVTQSHYVTNEVKYIYQYTADVLALCSFDNRGNRVGFNRGNATSTSFTPDAISRLGALSIDLGGTAYDSTTTLAYNPANQISIYTRSNDAYAWGGHFSRNDAYTINGLNQATTAGSKSIGYDGRGNVTSVGSDTYSYTAENRMITGPGGATLQYDPLGRLHQVSKGGLTTRFLYDGTDLVAEYDGSNVLQRRYVHGPEADEPVLWYEGSGTADHYYYYHDERGSVVAISNGAATNFTIKTYDEYGVPGGSTAGRFAYTGQTWLPEVGLYYYKARMYSPSLGRFMQTDPIGYRDGINWYAFVGNDPLNLNDSSGKAANLVLRGSYGLGRVTIAPLINWGIRIATGGAALSLGDWIYQKANESQDSDQSSPESPPAAPGTSESDKGAVYCCNGVSDGQRTPSGKPYVGSADNLGERAKTARDGRERDNATVIGEYIKGDRKGRQEAEQEGMNDLGGKGALDNKRDEIRKDQWSDRGVDPPKQ